MISLTSMVGAMFLIAGVNPQSHQWRNAKTAVAEGVV